MEWKAATHPLIIHPSPNKGRFDYSQLGHCDFRKAHIPKIMFIYLCVSMCVRVHIHTCMHSTCVGVRGQFAGVLSLLPDVVGSQRWNSESGLMGRTLIHQEPFTILVSTELSILLKVTESCSKSSVLFLKFVSAFFGMTPQTFSQMILDVYCRIFGSILNLCVLDVIRSSLIVIIKK